MEACGACLGTILRCRRYDGTLLKPLREEYESGVRDDEGTSIAMCLELELARKLLDYSNRLQDQCELIAVSSPALASLKETIHVDQGQVARCGWDPFQIGGDSLLYEGLFAAPEKFAAWHSKLNRLGLLKSMEDATGDAKGTVMSDEVRTRQLGTRAAG